METKVYLAGGMNKSNWQQRVINEILSPETINQNNEKFIFYNPREHELIDSKQFTLWDLFYVEKCDILFAYMQEDNPSGFGLTLEIGFARALHKPIILVDEKSNNDKTFERYFKIVRESASIVFEDINDGINFLKKIRNGIIML